MSFCLKSLSITPVNISIKSKTLLEGKLEDKLSNVYCLEITWKDTHGMDKRIISVYWPLPS